LIIVPAEMLTYAELGERLKISPEAARALVKRHRLPRSRANDGKTLVQVDLAEINHSPAARAPQAQSGQQIVTTLKQEIETLQAELIEMEAIAKGHRTDFERECERTNKLLAELIKITTETVAAREKAALLEGKVSVLLQPPQPRRSGLVDAFAHAFPQAASSLRQSIGRFARSQG
jgi:response regulator RpfG family c-di-GMP phosphodiesterase